MLPAALEISYDAPHSCPDKHHFEAAIERRIEGATPPSDDSSIPKRLEVRVQVLESGARARLVIVDRLGEPTVRELEAATCAEAVDGLALVVALLFDPDSSRNGSLPEPPAEARSAPKAPAREPSRRPIHVALGTSFFVGSGQSPALTPGGEASGVVIAQGAGPFRLLARTGVRLSVPSTISTAEGLATFEWWAAFLAFCPALASMGERVVGGVCASAELGVLDAAGADTRNPRDAARAWTSVGPGIVFAWTMLPPLYFLAAADAGFPLRRDRFLLGSQQIHEVPVAALRASVGLGVRIW